MKLKEGCIVGVRGSGIGGNAGIRAGRVGDLHCVLIERLLADSDTEFEASIAPGVFAHLKPRGVHLKACQIVERGGHDLMRHY